VDHVLRFEDLQNEMNSLMKAYNYTLRYSMERVNGGKKAQDSTREKMGFRDLDDDTI
jgi:hypothetical protein